MTDTKPRDLIQRLTEKLDHLHCQYNVPNQSALIAEARAYLAQPEPEGLTDEELLRAYGLAKRDHCYEGPIDDWPNRAERAATVHGLRAVIAADRARWGLSRAFLDSTMGKPAGARPAIKPVPVSERLPGPEDCNELEQFNA